MNESKSNQPIPMETTRPEILDDWHELLRRYQVPGIQISDDPEEELRSGVLKKVADSYRQNEQAGRQRLTEAFANLLQRRKKTLDQEMERVAEAAGEAELKSAQEKKPPLRDESKKRAKDFGLNLTVIAEFMDLTYDELESITGISRSTLHKIKSFKGIPTITSVFQVGIGIGLHPIVLMQNFESIEGTNIVTDIKPPLSSVTDEDLVQTREEMNKKLFDESNEAYDPAGWLTEVENTAKEIAPYTPSPGGVLGAVVGRHHGGKAGAVISAFVGHNLRNAVESELGGFKFPGRFIRIRIREKLDMNTWEEI